MLNRCFFIGNLVRDPELKNTPSGVSLCRFDIGVSRPYNQDGERVTDFFECTAWRGTAESIVKYCKKGHKVCVVGSVQTRTYEDNDGKKRKVYDIAVQEVEFLTPKNNAETAEFEPRQTSSTNRSASTQTSVFGRNKPTLQEMDDDSDIPF